ncbi:MAG: hypothetical protein WEF53_06595 [Bacteroidota bacterium]
MKSLTLEHFLEALTERMHGTAHHTSLRTEGVLALKRRIFGLLTFLTPVIFFLLVEVLLRVTDYGPSMKLFLREERGGKSYLVMNPDVRHRYFQTVDFSPTTSQDFFQSPKPTGVTRIFFLGGSTTVGFPYGYSGSFPAFVGDRLKRIFPSRKFEIINLAMTATNSFTTADIARELPAYEPDLIAVYDGHNEFYGALGVASRETPTGAQWTTDLHLRMVHWKTYILFRDILTSLSSLFGTAETLPTGTMMEHLAKDRLVRIDSELYATALQIFEDNLSSLAALCKSSSIPLVLGTQVSNLSDQPPFESEFTDHVPEDLLKIENLSSEAASYSSAGRHAEALESLQQAILLDSAYAMHHYRSAQWFEALGMKGQAFQAYSAARDHDLLRFRTDSRFNQIIRELGDGAAVAVADCEKVLQGHSQDSLLGFNFILEHLHPNLEGNFLLAKAYVDAMRHMGLFGDKDEWLSADTVDERSLRSERIVTELDRLAAGKRISLLLSGWPFNRTPEANPPSGMMDAFVDSLLYGSSSWEQVHVAAAQFYESKGMNSEAETEYRSLMDRLPYSVYPSLALGQVLIRQARMDDALSTFRQSLERERTAFGLVRIGGMELDRGNLPEALRSLEEAHSLSITVSDRLESSFFLGVAYYRTGEHALARRHLQNVLALNPSHQPAAQILRLLNKQ